MMIRPATLVSMLTLIPVTAAGQNASHTPAPLVFFDIAGPDGARLQRFYAELFGWTIEPGGTFTAPAAAPLPAMIRQDPAETVFYIDVDDITATLTKVSATGGSIVFPRLEVPGRVVLAMFRDPAGNRVGLVELKDGKPRIP